MSVVLDLLVQEVGELFKQPEPVWKSYKPSYADLQILETNSLTNNTFDKDTLKNKVWNEYKNGNYKCIGKTCEYGQVIALLPPGTTIPLKDWGRIFQFFGKPAYGPLWKVFWYGSPKKRLFPEDGEDLGPAHVNGGYTTPCSIEGVFIYRLEEATRVLIHELMHAACLDPPNETLPVREATVETWAEIILVALRSRGSFEKASRLWKQQAEWVVATNEKAQKKHGVSGEENYAWRYLNGRVQVYEDLGFALPAPKPLSTDQKSTRFTSPKLDNELGE